MKITDIKAYPVSCKPDRLFANSFEWKTSRGTTLVKISTDEGLVGWGEGLGPPMGIAAFVEKHLGPELIGKDPLQSECFSSKFQMRKGVPKGAIGGIDIALWDLKSRYFNVPLHRLLGGKFVDTIVPYATGFFYSEDKDDSTYFIEKEAEEIKAKGFKALKVKVGYGLERDIRRLKKVREIVGDAVDMMVDANEAYNLLTCLRLAPYLTELGVVWFEEPMAWAYQNGYKELRSKVSFAIAGGESETEYQGFVNAICNHTVDVIQPDIPGVGGITTARKLAVLAEAHQVEFQLHNFGSIVSVPASMQLIASLPNNQSWSLFPRSVLFEWDTTSNSMVNAILQEPLQMTDGLVEISDKAGFADLNEDAIKHYQMK